jgi:hypothetical protein
VAANTEIPFNRRPIYDLAFVLSLFSNRRRQRFAIAAAFAHFGPHF